MNEAFHTNIELAKTDTHYVTIIKTRLWPFQLMSLNWLIRKSVSISCNIENGLGLIIINTLALSVEGFIADVINEEQFEHEFTKNASVKNSEPKTWSKKKQLFNALFSKKIESYDSYQSIEHLFHLRNNIAHGRTHFEIISIEIATQLKTKIESTDKNYEKVRRYLINQNLIADEEIPSNAKTLWTLSVALFFYDEVKRFLISIITHNESTRKAAIQAEFETIVNNGY
jgi:hypothetical protein